MLTESLRTLMARFHLLATKADRFLLREHCSGLGLSHLFIQLLQVWPVAGWSNTWSWLADALYLTDATVLGGVITQ